MSDFKITSAVCGVIAAGKVNAGKKYATIGIKPLITRNGVERVHPLANEIKVTIFEEQNQSLYETLASVIPTSKGGTSAVQETQWSMRSAMAELENLGSDIIPNGSYQEESLGGGTFCMKYGSDLNGHKEGEFVLGNGGFIKTTKTAMIFTASDGEGNPIKGFSAKERLASAMQNLVPIEAVAVDPTWAAKLNPRDLPSYQEPLPPTEEGEPQI